jgi:hypothetical protein
MVVRRGKVMCHMINKYYIKNIFLKIQNKTFYEIMFCESLASTLAIRIGHCQPLENGQPLDNLLPTAGSM